MNMVVFNCRISFCYWLPSSGVHQIKTPRKVLLSEINLLTRQSSGFRKPTVLAVPKSKGTDLSPIRCSHIQSARCLPTSDPVQEGEPNSMIKKRGKPQNHFWKKRNVAGSGRKAFNLVRIVSDSELPHHKEAVYRALDKWIAWELEFPLIAAAKALRILRKRKLWIRAIQVAKWMLSKGQGATMRTYDTLLLAFDMDGRVEEAESLWNMILHTLTRSTSKQLFSRMVCLYDHHNMPDKVVDVFADMEELAVKPDEGTVRRVARAFENLGQDDKKKLVLERYQCKWKYIHFNGERVRVRRDPWDDDE